MPLSTPAPPESVAEPDTGLPLPISPPPELMTKYERAREDLRGDRREVVVLFGDLSGFTALSERLDPEEVSLLMQGLLRELANVVYRYEGYVDKYIGDAIMALFGAPIAHENDAERAVLAALDMLEVTARRSEGSTHPLSLRVGLNLGEVVAAHVGSEARHQYTVMGDTVNVASRLESAAAPDSVLVSRSVFDRIGFRFETEEVPPLTVKGKAEPLQAYRVLRYRPATTAPGSESTVFVGRSEELAALELFFRRVTEGAGGTFVIEAEAGTGKTRLIREGLRRTQTRLDTLEVDFSQIDLPGGLAVAADLFRRLVDADPQSPEDATGSVERAAELLAEEMDEHRAGVEGLVRQVFPQSAIGASLEEEDPNLARQNRWLAVASLLAARARNGPLLILFEDVHWADEADQMFLEFLVTRLPGQRVGVVATARPGSSLPWLPADHQRLELRNLDEEAARSILGELFGTLRPRMRKELIRRSEGNPFYLEQLAWSLRGVVEAAAASVPGTVQGLLQSRMDRLPAPVRLLLQMASVLGSPFSVELLARIYRLENQPLPFSEALETLKREDFFEDVGDASSVRFRHALMQEVAYGSILNQVRKVLHESAARLGEEQYAERLEAEAPFFAHHYWEAGLLSDAASHLWNAGRMAARDAELHSAERFLRRLAEIIDQQPDVLQSPEERASFMSTYGAVLQERALFQEAEEWFRKLQAIGEKEDNADWLAKALFHLGTIAWYRGRSDEAEEAFQKGLSRVNSRDEHTIASLHSGLGLVYYRRNDVRRCLEEHGQALRLRQGIDDRLGVVKSLMNIGGTLYELQDDLGGAQGHYERALQLAREIGYREIQCNLLLNLGLLDLERGDYHASLERIDDAQERVDEIGLTYLRFLGLRHQAASHVRLGRIQQALQELKSCVEEGDEFLDPVNRVASRILKYEAYMSAMAEEQAVAALQEARELAETLEVTDLDDWLLLSEGRWKITAGRWDEAAEDFSRAAELATGMQLHGNARIARAHYWRARAHADAVPPDVPPVETDPRRSVTAVLRYLRGDTAALQGDLDNAIAELSQAGELATSMGEMALERAAFERQAQIMSQLGDSQGEKAARLRAARILATLKSRLPAELRENFEAHPRNAALRETAHV
ncbi:MAG: adenylate/guanylate cyclase domain-containing protein [Gemmatimonadota bacterium]